MAYLKLGRPPNEVMVQVYRGQMLRKVLFGGICHVEHHQLVIAILSEQGAPNGESLIGNGAAIDTNSNDETIFFVLLLQMIASYLQIAHADLTG